MNDVKNAATFTQYKGVIDMKPTIKQVAEAAGVSIATVSRVLNGKDRVKESTRIKIQEAINRLNYQPDLNARSMIKKETKTIGLIVPELMNEYWVQMFDELQEAFWPKGYSLMLGSTNRSADRERAFLKSFIERRVDGLIIGPSFDTAEDEEALEILDRYSIPVVTLDPKNRAYDCMVGDHLQGATEAVQHLIRLGHRDIALLCGSSMPDTRELGLRNAFLLNGMQVNEDLIVRVEGPVNFQTGYLTTKTLLRRKVPFTAIFAYNDVVAFGAIRAMEEEGLRVPDDVAVVGYDDIQMASMFRPSLTTVRQPIRDIARSLAQLMVEIIEMDEEERKRSPKKVISFQMELVVRESCGARMRQNSE